MEVRNKTDGAAKVAVGKFEEELGEALGDVELRAEGAALEIEGRVQEAAGLAQEALVDVAEKTKAVFSKVGDAYARTADSTRVFRHRIEQRPVLSLALAAAGGLVLGLLMGGRGPKVIYVKSTAPGRPSRA